MSVFDPSPSRWSGQMLSIFRIVAGLVFVSFGSMIVFGFPPNPQAPPFNAMTQAGIGGLLELIGGTLIVLGLLTRPVAFILSGMMAVAYFQFHAPQSFYPSNNMGTPSILYCFFFLYLVFSGAGAWSLDSVIFRSRGGGRDATPRHP
jgi:putative oxidoreductase